MSYKIEDLIKAVKIEAEKRKEDAAHGGRMGDDGASLLLKQVEYYEMGRKNIYPFDWERYAKHIDPEFQEFLRLKKKFNQ